MSAKRTVVQAMQSVCRIVADVGPYVELLHSLPIELQRLCRFPVHAYSHCIIVSWGGDAIVKLIGPEGVAESPVVRRGSYPTRGKDTKPVAVAEPFRTNTHGEFRHQVIVKVRVNTVPFNILNCPVQ